MRISPAAPAAPEPGRIVTPGVFPCSTSFTFRIEFFSVSSATSSCVMEFPTVRRSTAPAVPVTTTWSSCAADCASSKLTVPVAPAFTVTARICAWKPMRRTRSSRAPAGTLTMRYSPAAFVIAPNEVPTTATWASLTGRCPPFSTTRPRMEPVVCAPAAGG
jgi:hypothetical protein